MDIYISTLSHLLTHLLIRQNYFNKTNSTTIHKMILNKKVNKEFTLVDEAFPDLNQASMMKAIATIDDSSQPYQYSVLTLSHTSGSFTFSLTRINSLRMY